MRNPNAHKSSEVNGNRPPPDWSTWRQTQHEKIHNQVVFCRKFVESLFKERDIITPMWSVDITIVWFTWRSHIFHTIPHMIETLLNITAFQPWTDTLHSSWKGNLLCLAAFDLWDNVWQPAMTHSRVFHIYIVVLCPFCTMFAHFCPFAAFSIDHWSHFPAFAVSINSQLIINHILPFLLFQCIVCESWIIFPYFRCFTSFSVDHDSYFASFSVRIDSYSGMADLSLKYWMQSGNN
jgi:hypothetical protein